MYWVTAVYQTLRDTDIYYSIHRYRTPAVCPALEVLKCIIHSFTHLFTIHVLSTCCVPGSWGPNIHYSFIHPFTLHTLTAYCLLSTWLCPWLGQATWQPEASDFMELSFAFLKSQPHHYTGSSQWPVERRYFHDHFMNQHVEGRRSWVICSGSAESKLEPGCLMPEAVFWMSHSPSPGPLMAPHYLWQRTYTHDAGVNAARTGGPGWMKENLPCLASLSSRWKLTSQSVDPKLPDNAAFQKPTPLFTFMQKYVNFETEATDSKFHKALHGINHTHLGATFGSWPTCLPPGAWKGFHLAATWMPGLQPQRSMLISSPWALLSLLQDCLAQVSWYSPIFLKHKENSHRQGNPRIFKILKREAQCLPATSLEITWSCSLWTRGWPDHILNLFFFESQPKVVTINHGLTMHL